MSPADLVVVADLDVHVVTPDGRTARVRLSDEAGTLVVDVRGPRVLLAGLPGGVGPSLRPALRVASSVARRVHDATGARWAQPVEVRLDGRVVLRRQDGAWRPGTGLRRPLGVATAVLAGAAAVVVAVVVAVRGHRSTG